MVLHYTAASNPVYETFKEEVFIKSEDWPFCANLQGIKGTGGSLQWRDQATHLYDALIVYATALTKAMEEGYTVHNGSEIVKKVLNQRYDSKCH